MSVNLKELDLTLGEGHEHPDIKIGKDSPFYLCKIRGRFYAGRFGRQWFGLNFHGFTSVCGSIQYDKPGTNRSGWEGIWEIVPNEN